MSYFELTDSFEVPADVERTWRFFSTAENLPLITPAWMHFTIVTPGPIEIGADSILDYRVRVNGIPVRWQTRIIDWSPPRQFIDLQIRGPYTLWHHQHTFTPSAGGVTCSDRVIYKLPGGPIGKMVHAISVRRQLIEIFRYRRGVIAQQLGGLRAVQEDVTVRAPR